MKILELLNIKEHRLNPRITSAILLLAISLLAAIAISSSANRSVYVWAANNQLPSGSEITALDLKKVKVFLPENSKRYISVKAHVIGATLIRKIGDGELIPAAAITNERSAKLTKSVPIKIARNDYPADLLKGDTIDVYSLPIRETNNKEVARLIAESITIESIDIRGREIGGEIGVVIKLPSESIEEFLSNTINSKLVVVRSAI